MYRSFIWKSALHLHFLSLRAGELATKSKNKNISDLYREINYFKKGYQPRSNLVKNEDGDLLSDSHNILNRWKSDLSVIECT
jgi:hypothetical protein